MIPLAGPPSSSARYARVPVLEKHPGETASSDDFDAWIEANARWQRENNTCDAKTDLNETQPERKGFRDTMVDFVSRVYSTEMGLNPENVSLPLTSLGPFGCNLISTLITSIEVTCRPSLPALELGDDLEQIVTADYALERWEAFREALEGTQQRRDATYIQTILGSLFLWDKTSASASSASADALYVVKKLIFGGMLSSAKEQQEKGGGGHQDLAQLLHQLKEESGGQDDEPTMLPLLQIDPFKLLVAAVLLQRADDQQRLGQADITHLMRLLLVASVLQTLVTILEASSSRSKKGEWSGAETEIKEPATVLDQTLYLVMTAINRAMAGSQSFESSSALLDKIRSMIAGEQLEKEVKRLCLPFLYRTALFHHLCLARPMRSTGTTLILSLWDVRGTRTEATCAMLAGDILIQSESDEFAALLNLLDIQTSLDDLLSPLLRQSDEPRGLARLVHGWLSDFFAFHRSNVENGTSLLPLSSRPIASPSLPFELNRYVLLPALFPIPR